jgi:hypothetical protein
MVAVLIIIDTETEMKQDELRQRGWKTIASVKADSEGKFSFQMAVPTDWVKSRKQKVMAVVTDSHGNIVQTSNTIDILVRKPSGSCPKCYSPTYPTGKSRRVRTTFTASVSHSPLKMEWKYEKEHQCTKCRRKFPESLISSYEE